MSAGKHSDNLKEPSRWFGTVFLSVLIGAGLASLFSESEGVSIAENRALSPMPEFSAWALFSGEYTDSLDLYYSDNFPIRDKLVQAATTIRDWSGYHREIVYYKAIDPLPQVAVQQVDTTTMAKADSIKAEPVRADTVKVQADYDRSAGIVVYDNRAIQIFTVSSDGPGRYADMVNLYRRTFPSLNVFCMVAPTQTDFYLPNEYKRSSNHEYKMIDSIRSLLDSTVSFADAYRELEPRTQEYIYFNTDHHWTGRGAYYAYVAFCKSAGIEPYPLDSLQRRQQKRKFLGSLYSITLDKRLKERRDSVEYWRLPIATRVFRWNNDSSRYESSRLFANTHNYTNFIGGDHPMVRIESDVNPKRILVIKDSYGNAVMPFLALHFGTVYVMDYRYFDMNVRNFVEYQGITDIMFLNNTFAANAKYTSYRGRYLLNWRPAISKPAPADSTAANAEKKEDEQP